MAATVFTAIALLAARQIVLLVRSSNANNDPEQSTNNEGGKDALLYSSMGVAILNVAIDVHYAHPIPHAGESLNMLMHSNVTVEKQALLPFLSVILSVVGMVLTVISHRALTDLSALSRRSGKKTS